jgi:N-acetylglucosaminyldiphosphoundecaprenol N-acetyl-beta-D-mannosaminyltransferase
VNALAAPPRRIDLMGMRIDAISEADAIGTIIDALEHDQGGWVITPNLHHLREFTRRQDLREPFEEADLVVADGMPLVWASHVKRTPLPARVAGSDLVWSLSAEAALNERSVYLLGAEPPACQAAEQRMHELYPGLRIAGCYSPPVGFEDDPEEMSHIRARLMAAEPDIVFVALGFPKQELLIRSMRSALPSSWFLGVGASLNFVGGTTERAPDWMIQFGLEWLHRLSQEPRRLFRRYVIEGVPFAARLLVHAARQRRRALPAPSMPALEPRTRARVVFTHGAFERQRAEDIRVLLAETAAEATASSTAPATAALYASSPNLAAVAKPDSRSRDLSPGSPASLSTAPASSPAWSRGKIRQFWSWRRYSAEPPVPVATTGVPTAIASSGTSPHGSSQRTGKTTTSAAA